MKKISLLVTVLAVCLMTGCANRLEKGVKHLENGEYEEAITWFEEQIENGKELGEAYRGIGIAQFEIGDYEASKEAFEQAVQNGTKETVSLYHLLGTCCLELELYEEALNYYEKGVAMKDVSGEVLREMQFNIIGLYEKLGDWDSAKVKVQEYLNQYPEDEAALKEAEFLKTR